MRPIKKSPFFANGGSWGDVDYDTPKSNRDLRKEEREDKKGMIPARFRNRGQEGLDAYRLMMQNKRRRGNQGLLQRLRHSLPFYNAKRKNASRLAEGASGAGSGCEKTGSCGAFD
jgi:hypothetical protein